MEEPRRATPGDLALVRDVRLRALAEAPEAFDSTHAGALAWDDQRWRRWIEEGVTFLLPGPDRAMGLVRGVPDPARPRSPFLMSLWLDPALRGTGAGDRLVGAVLRWARDAGAREVVLHVDKRDARARRFYERNGFRVTGAELARERDGLPELEMRKEPLAPQTRYALDEILGS